MSDLDDRSALWHGLEKIVNLGGNNIFENTDLENNFEDEKVGPENSIIWYYKYSNSIHVDMNHYKLNQLILGDSTNIRSITDYIYIEII